MTRIVDTEVLVIGGGATGTGVLRDLAMRGFCACLVEKRDLAHGTTGRYHGLLHSGGRYVVKDSQAARECFQENQILRQIMPTCIENTGGYFVTTPWDELEFGSKFLEGCKKAGIPVEKVAINHMLKEEPRLNPKITQCYRLPDATADSFKAAELNIESGRQHGANFLPYHEVVLLLQSGTRIIGARCHDLIKDEFIDIHADIVVNATGAWCGKIAKNVGINISIIPGKGTMIALNHRVVHTVINRCKMPSDGDILVPTHTVTIMGTTDVPVKNPDQFAIEPWEVHLLLDEGEKLIPGFVNMRMLRAWAGVRPLYQETEITNSREVTRAFVLLDHESRDNISGLVTITSGKWTTYRKMAEATVDLICLKLGTQRACRTHIEPLPGTTNKNFHYLGERLARIEKEQDFGSIICECELTSIADVKKAIVHGEAKTIDDIRRDVRLGMGPCQGGFCTYRVAGILHELRKTDVQETNIAIRDFLQERWKGLLPILWGQQLRQERLDELIYINVLDAGHLKGPKTSRLSPENYLAPEEHLGARKTLNGAHVSNSLTSGESTSDQIIGNSKSLSSQPDLHNVIVIGSGLSGLSTAWQASKNGKNVKILTKGWGSLFWSTGCMDLLGYFPVDNPLPVFSPLESINQLIIQNPGHPYATAGLATIVAALEDFQTVCAEFNYPMHGSIERNWILPSALGVMRPTCLAPDTMIAGDLSIIEPMLIVGFEQFKDFYPQLIADNLSAQGIPAKSMTLDLSDFINHRQVTGLLLARLFESKDYRIKFVEILKKKFQTDSDIPSRIGFPAVLGLENPLAVKAHLELLLNRAIFEIPTLPPSVPGIRLHRLLSKAVHSNAGEIFEGMQVISYKKEDSRIKTLLTEAASRRLAHHAQDFVLATGGILGGGLFANYDGSLVETIFNIPISFKADRTKWFDQNFLSNDAHPIFSNGIIVNEKFQPVKETGITHFDNLYTVGSSLSSSDYLREMSQAGVSLVTGYAVGKNLTSNLNSSLSLALMPNGNSKSNV